MTTPMRFARRILPIVAVLLLAGAGCSLSPRARVQIGTRAMVPSNIPIMKGLEPRDEGSWRVIPEAEGKRRLESRWTIDQPFDKVVAWYLERFEKQGLSTHTIENADGVRIYWGTSEQAYYADRATNASIFVNKTKDGGKTAVEMELDLPPT
jgi:hypothetical protein